MAQSTVLRLRGWWLSVHKWIGIMLAVLIIPISITGSALVWHDWLDEQINPQRYAVSTSETRLSPAQYAADAARIAAASGAASADRIALSGRRRGAGRGLTRAQGAGRGGPPPRTNVWLDPGTGGCSTSPTPIRPRAHLPHLHGIC